MVSTNAICNAIWYHRSAPLTLMGCGDSGSRRPSSLVANTFLVRAHGEKYAQCKDHPEHIPFLQGLQGRWVQARHVLHAVVKRSIQMLCLFDKGSWEICSACSALLWQGASSRAYAFSTRALGKDRSMGSMLLFREISISTATDTVFFSSQGKTVP